MSSLLIKDALMLSETEPVDLYIKDGIICEIKKGIEANADKVFDAKRNVIIPGLIDMHCNISDPSYENSEDLIFVSNSAARGGYTSITYAPNVMPVIDNKTVVQYIISRSKAESSVNIFPYGSMTKGCKGTEISEIGEMNLAGIVAISDGGASIEDANLLRNIFLYSKMFNIPIITHCEDKNLANDGVVNGGYISTLLGLKGIPREAEEVVVARNIVIASNTQASLHLTKISTKGSVELIRAAKAKGIRITCDTCPQYFTLTEETVDAYNTFAKVKPPLRTAEDVAAIKEGVLDGTIDIITTGHFPMSVVSKKLEFDNASYAILSIETAFALSYSTFVATNLMTLDKLVEKMSTTPARILDLKTKGVIKEGFDADLTLIEVNSPFDIRSSEFLSKSKFSLYEGVTVKGKILNTFVAGRCVYK